MIIKIDGHTFEFDNESLKQTLRLLLVDGLQPEQTTKVTEVTGGKNILVKKTFRRHRTYSPRVHTSDGIWNANKDFFINNKNRSVKWMAKKLGMTESVVSNCLYKKVGGVIKLRQKYAVDGEKPLKHTDHQKVNRMRFLASRASWLMNNYNWSREKAYQYAAEEWKQKKKITPKKKADDRPSMIELSDQGNNTFIDWLKFAAENGGTMTLWYASYNLQTRDDLSWTVKVWCVFCQRFILKSGEYAEHLGVKNKFKLEGESEQMVITYG